MDGFGVISGRIHSKEEYAYLDSLKEAAKKLAVVGYYIKKIGREIMNTTDRQEKEHVERF